MILKWEEELLPVTLITFMSDIGFGLCKLKILEIGPCANISARFSPHSTPNNNQSLIKTLKNIVIDNTPTAGVHMTSAVLSSLKIQYGSKLQKSEPNAMAKYKIDYLMTSKRAIQHYYFQTYLFFVNLYILFMHDVQKIVRPELEVLARIRGSTSVSFNIELLRYNFYFSKFFSRFKYKTV